MKPQVRKVIAIQPDIQSPHRDLCLLQLSNFGGEPPGKRDTPGAHPHKDQIRTAFISLYNFVSDTAEGSPYILFIHYDFIRHEKTSCPLLARGPVKYSSTVTCIEKIETVRDNFFPLTSLTGLI
jgi:hypothetical protein